MPTPNLCHITGYVEDLLGVCPADLIFVATPTVPSFNGGWLVPVLGTSFYPQLNGPSGGTPPVSGYFDMPLYETETSGILVAFRAVYTGDGIYREIPFSPVLIPNQESVHLSDLLIPILNSS